MANKNFPNGMPEGWHEPAFTIFSIDRNDQYTVPEIGTKSVDELIHHPLLWDAVFGNYNYSTTGLVFDLKCTAAKFATKIMQNMLYSVETGNGLKIPKVVCTRKGIVLLDLLISATTTNGQLKEKSYEFCKNDWNEWVDNLNTQIETAHKILSEKIPDYETARKLTETEEELEQTKKLLKDTEHENDIFRRKLDRMKDFLND